MGKIQISKFLFKGSNKIEILYCDFFRNKKAPKNRKSKIVLIDNYVDDSTLTLFQKNQDIDVVIYTQTITKALKLDLAKYNKQYKNITIKENKDFHDRFLILDEKEVYHIGASLKDLGKKVFGFSKMQDFNPSLLKLK